MEEREAFQKFYLDNSKKLYRVVERLQEIQEGKLGNVTEDIVQECFLVAFIKWENVKGCGNPLGWLVVTAKYVIANQIRKRDNQTVPYRGDVLADVIGEMDPNLTLIDINQLLKEILPDSQERELFTYYLYGYKSSEIADKMQMNDNTVRVKI